MPVPDDLPLLTLYLTERCNSRCVTCEHWQHGRIDLSLESVRALLPSLLALGTRIVQLSGGEPLVHPHWAEIAQLLRHAGIQVWLLTAGVALAKQSVAVARSVDHLIVSLDGADRATYAAIRGVDAFDKVCEGIKASVTLGRAPTLRVTLQRRNFRQLAQFIRLARALGARQISFLAVDTGNAQAFGRGAAPLSATVRSSTLEAGDLPEFDGLLRDIETAFQTEFAAGFIAESPQKLRHLLQYFAAVCGTCAYPSVHCKAPEFSAVIDALGKLHPCFFIAGNQTPQSDTRAALAFPDMRALRADIAGGRRTECRTCVCSLSRAPR